MFALVYLDSNVNISYARRKQYNDLFLNLQASDVLAVELLQKDTRLAVTSEHGKPCPGGT